MSVEVELGNKVLADAVESYGQALAKDDKKMLHSLRKKFGKDEEFIAFADALDELYVKLTKQAARAVAGAAP